jgi:hypothetical protein
MKPRNLLFLFPDFGIGHPPKSRREVPAETDVNRA